MSAQSKAAEKLWRELQQVAPPRDSTERARWQREAQAVAAALGVNVGFLADFALPLIEPDIFIGDPRAHVVHHAASETAGCGLNAIEEPILFESLSTAKKAGFPCCQFCFARAVN